MAEKGTKLKAFLVGINEYESPYNPPLTGCINDLEDMADTLVYCGITPDRVKINTNEAATKRSILSGIDWLLKGASTDDSLVFYYAGHGSKIPHILNEEEVEVDRVDETLVPYDNNPRDTTTHISDDEIRDKLSKLDPGINLEVIIDSCHSGTATRGGMDITLSPMITGNETANELRRAIDSNDPKNILIRPTTGRMSRFVEPPIDLNFYIKHSSRIPITRFLRGSEKIRNPPLAERTQEAAVSEIVTVGALNHTLWAACKDNQDAEEIYMQGKKRGVFTYYFCRILRNTNGRISRRRLHDLIVAAIREEIIFRQIPQLEVTSANTDQNIFT